MLVELSVVEQRYHAVMEVISGAPVTEVALRYGISRQSVHNWLSSTGQADWLHLPTTHTGRVSSRGRSTVMWRR